MVSVYNCLSASQQHAHREQPHQHGRAKRRSHVAPRKSRGVRESCVGDGGVGGVGAEGQGLWSRVPHRRPGHRRHRPELAVQELQVRRVLGVGVAEFSAGGAHKEQKQRQTLEFAQADTLLCPAGPSPAHTQALRRGQRDVEFRAREALQVASPVLRLLALLQRFWRCYPPEHHGGLRLALRALQGEAWGTAPVHSSV